MAPTTIKGAIAETLEDLSKMNFLKFCHQLRDRREEPRIRLSAVEDKNICEITDLLVSTFTELGARLVTLETLRQINCNAEAEALESKTKVCMDKGDPTFRKTLTGKLETKASQEAQNHAAGRLPLQAAQHGRPPVKKPEEVEAEAKARVVSEGGDANNDRLVLSRCTIQFGTKYVGKSFKWVLENDPVYAAFVVAQHQRERESTMRQDPLMANKDSFTRYAMAYPEFVKEVKFQQAYQRSLQSGRKGKALVGFHTYRSETLQDLYESKDPKKISYVNFLRDKKSTCDPGSKMEAAVKYILQRDKRKAAADRKKQAQRTRSWTTTASRPRQKKLKMSWRRTRP